jgi:hypothetical protein
MLTMVANSGRGDSLGIVKRKGKAISVETPHFEWCNKNKRTTNPDNAYGYSSQIVPPKVPGYCIAGSARQPPMAGAMKDPRVQANELIANTKGSFSGVVNSTKLVTTVLFIGWQLSFG